METKELHHYKTLVAKLPLLKKEIAKIIVGQQKSIDEILISLLAGGHCLLEGVPGLAKTLMVSTLSETLDMKFKRIQFTPDLMPGDIVGTEILEEDHETGKKFFKFNRGRFLQTSFWRMKSIEHHQKHKRLYSKQCKNIRLLTQVQTTIYQSLS